MLLIRTGIAILLFVCCSAVPASESSDYVLRDMNGEIHRVSDNRGKWLVINFWATWCAPCIEEMPDFPGE